MPRTPRGAIVIPGSTPRAPRDRAIMIRRRAALLAAAALVAAAPCDAQLWTFVARDYFDPLTAGVREPHVSALGFARADRFAYQVEPDEPRQVWDIDLGAEIPLFGWETARALNERVGDGEFGIGFWIPIDFHMIEDFVDASNPIVNTDYRFGGMVKAQYGVSPTQWLSLRAFAGHESTHLGDEYSLAAARVHPTTFERINVSWEFLDLAVRYDDRSSNALWHVALGATSTLPFEDSYYSVDENSATESPVGPVIESHNWIDPYVSGEVHLEQFSTMSAGILGRWGGYLAAEVRRRSIYDYHRANRDVGEERQLSFNVIAGIQPAGGRLERASPFVRVYRGVNPHGQFRNQSSFTLWGIGLRLRR
jgi:hypothetical protein